MRHVWSLLAGVVIAPLTWCLVALGQNGSQEKVADWVDTGRWDGVDLIEPAIYLAVAGILLGLIATLRLSPVGPLVGGLLLLAAYVGLFISPLDVRDALPDNWEIQDRHIQLLGPLDNGTLALIGMLLVMAVFSPGRWRRRPPAAPGAELAAPGGAALTAPGAADAPAAVTVPEPVGEPVTASPATPQPATVPRTGTEATTEATTEPVTTPGGSPAKPGESPTGSPWSAPPGQGQSAKS